MSASITNLGQLIRAAVERRETLAATASWRNREWRYQPAATHADSQAFCERMAARMAAAQPKRAR